MLGVGLHAPVLASTLDHRVFGVYRRLGLRYTVLLNTHPDTPGTLPCHRCPEAELRVHTMAEIAHARSVIDGAPRSRPWVRHCL